LAALVPVGPAFRRGDATSVLVQPDGKVVATGWVGDNEIYAFAALRLEGSSPVAARKLCNGVRVTVDLAQGGQATAGADVILGTPPADTINGRGGADIICGLGGADTIRGGGGGPTTSTEGEAPHLQRRPRQRQTHQMRDGLVTDLASRVRPARHKSGNSPVSKTGAVLPGSPA